MSNSLNSVTLAPAGILRAATWPIECLAGLGDRSLAELAIGTIEGGDWDTYLSAYDRAVDRDRECLMSVTVRDLRFRKAIRLSNPIVAAKIEALLQLPGELPHRNKMVRRLEHTLYRYLARAIGRTTPNGLWAGVGLVEFSTQPNTTIDQIAAEYYFAPDLRPFQSMLRSLGKLPNYRERTCWRVNPTLIRQPDGCWQFWARTEAGAVEQYALESDDSLAELLNILIQQETGTFAELLAAIQADQPELLTLTLPDLLETLVAEGILQGGLDLPQRFATVWDALTTAAQSLLPADRSHWNRSISELQACCQTLSAQIETIELAELELQLARATECVVGLARCLNLSLEHLPDPIVHCDLKLPLRVKLARHQQASILRSIDFYQAYWVDGIAPTTALRQDLRQQLTAKLQPDLQLGEIAADTLPQINRSDRNSVLNRQLIAWEHLLQTETTQITLEHPHLKITSKSPLGCLYCLPSQGFKLQIRGIDDDPARGFARFGKFLDPEGWLHTWLKQEIVNLHQQQGTIVADLQIPFESNPNVLARDTFCADSIALWYPASDTLSLQAVKIGIDATTSLPCLKLPTRADPIAVFGFSVAHVSAIDPLAELLFYTGFQERPIAIAMAATLPTAPELAKPRQTPRICLPEGSYLRPQRTVLNVDILSGLIPLTPAQRYVQWQKLAIEHQWSDLLMLQIDRDPPLLLKRDSPLALESIFKSVRPHTQWLIVEETIDLPWLVDAENRHYLAEIAFPLSRNPSELRGTPARPLFAVGGEGDSRAVRNPTPDQF
jgi:Lantibiotic dehydratase, N terminus